MRKLLLALLAPFALLGCVGEPVWTPPAGMPQGMAYANPLLVPSPDAQYVFAIVADVIGDYFRLDHEEPVRSLGAMLTEGRIDTFPKVGATVFEPWDHDSADRDERVESTLQSIRRHAVVKVVPSREGFWIDVVVLKELENMAQPEYATAGKGTFPHDVTQSRVIDPMLVRDPHLNWIPLGRDPVLEQRIIGQLRDRFNMR